LVADVPPAHAAAINVVSSAESFVAGFLLVLVLLIAFALLVRKRLKSARHKLQQANELADHREYERNLTQQELIRRLEEERELAKEKLQFESRLAEYENVLRLRNLRSRLPMKSTIRSWESCRISNSRGEIPQATNAVRLTNALKALGVSHRRSGVC